MTPNIHGLAKKIVRFYLVWWIALLWNILITFLVTDISKYSYNVSLFFVFLFNITIVFYLQKYFTFKNTTRKKIQRQITSFVVLVIFLMVSLKLLVPFLNRYVYNYSLSTLVVSWLITIINFIIQNHLIFPLPKNDK